MSDRADVDFVSRVVENTKLGLLRWERWDQPWSQYGAMLPTKQALTLDRRLLDDVTAWDEGWPPEAETVVLELHKDTGETARTFLSGPDSRDEVGRLVDVLWDLVGERDTNDELSKAFSGLDELAKKAGTR
ncbi:MAG: hypothetical protein FJX74_17420 [Armatimonadetes bacterium]|nr:hypothetical protein [Armatimonadota bacterium]